MVDVETVDEFCSRVDEMVRLSTQVVLELSAHAPIAGIPLRWMRSRRAVAPLHSIVVMPMSVWITPCGRRFVTSP